VCYGTTVAEGSAVAVLRYHEIALKGRNRPLFVRCLERHIQRVLVGLPVGPVGRASARLVVPIRDECAWPEIRARLTRVFGLANLALAHELALPADPDAALERIGNAVLERLRGVDVPSFRVLTKRGDKTFPHPSPEVNRRLGAGIQAMTGAPVDLKHAAVTVAVDLLRTRAFYSFEKVPGAGGLPVPSAGTVLALLSGGIDSPVAAWRMMRRGCRVDFVHFHSVPFTDRTSQEKARTLARLLTTWELDATLLLVPFAEVQRQIVAAVERPLRVVLYRRMMVRIAEALARVRGAEALVTGESLGQVASQTLGNMAVIGEVATLPLLRPLIGMDKEEISRQAERIGTFETSIVPDQDCCQVFVPKHPTTRARPDAVLAAEARYDVPALVAMAAAAAEPVRFRYPEVAVETLAAAPPAPLGV
jgi:thiamine biosynthesis protein ThiI